MPLTVFVESSLAYPHERQDNLTQSRSGIRTAIAFLEQRGHTTHTSSMKSESRRFPSTNRSLFPDITHIDVLVSAETLKSIFGTIDFEENDLQPIMDLLIHDKKNEYGKIQFALLDGVGKIKINQEADNELITKSFAAYKN